MSVKQYVHPPKFVFELVGQICEWHRNHPEDDPNFELPFKPLPSPPFRQFRFVMDCDCRDWQIVPTEERPEYADWFEPYGHRIECHQSTAKARETIQRLLDYHPELKKEFGIQ